MTDHIDDRAAFIAALSKDDPEWITASQHAASCARCARSLAEAGGLLQLIDAVLPPPPSDAALEQAKAAVLAELDRLAPVQRTTVRAPSRVGFGAPAALLALVLSAFLAWFDAEGGPLAARTGIECLLIELCAAAGCLYAGLLVHKRGVEAISVSAAPALTAFGALAGQAYLHLRCPVAHSGVHVAVFHLGGVVLAALLGTALGRRLPWRTA